MGSVTIALVKLGDAVAEHEAWARMNVRGGKTLHARFAAVVDVLGPEREVSSIAVGEVRAAFAQVTADVISWRRFWWYAISQGYTTDPAPGRGVHLTLSLKTPRLSAAQVAAIEAYQASTYNECIGIALVACALCGVGSRRVASLTVDMVRLDYGIVAHGDTRVLLDDHARWRLRDWLDVRVQLGEQRALFTQENGTPWRGQSPLIALVAALGLGVDYAACWQHWRAVHQPPSVIKRSNRKQDRGSARRRRAAE